MYWIIDHLELNSFIGVQVKPRAVMLVVPALWSQGTVAVVSRTLDPSDETPQNQPTKWKADEGCVIIRSNMALFDVFIAAKSLL